MSAIGTSPCPARTLSPFALVVGANDVLDVNVNDEWADGRPGLGNAFARAMGMSQVPHHGGVGMVRGAHNASDSHGGIEHVVSFQRHANPVRLGICRGCAQALDDPGVRLRRRRVGTLRAAEHTDHRRSPLTRELDESGRPLDLGRARRRRLRQAAIAADHADFETIVRDQLGDPPTLPGGNIGCQRLPSEHPNLEAMTADLASDRACSSMVHAGAEYVVTASRM